MSAEARLKELGLELPAPPSPVAAYVTLVQTGHLAFLAGHISVRANGQPIVGKVGGGLSVEQGYEAARVAGLNLLATLRGHLGSLDRVRRVVKVLGMVNATPEFTQHPQVVNGCSDLLFQLFGEAGRHARSAMGVASLPLGVAVEIEAVVEVT